MSVLNRPLFQRYARQPMMQQPMQQPMMQQPTGIMASSPELMQASMGYKQGGMVQGYQDGTTVHADPLARLRALAASGQDAAVYDAQRSGQPATDITLSPADFAAGQANKAPAPGSAVNDYLNRVDSGEIFNENMAAIREANEGSEDEPSTSDGFVPQFPGDVPEGTLTDEPSTSDGFVPQFPGDVPEGTLTIAEALALGAKVEEGTVDAGMTPKELDQSPSEQASAALKAAGKNVPKGTKGKIEAMKSLISDAFGVDASRYDNLRSLNRAAVGFAIAEGGDIATALKQGAQGAAAITEKQLAREDEITGMAVSQVFAEKAAAAKAAAKSPKSILETPQGELAAKLYVTAMDKDRLTEAQARQKVNDVYPGLGDLISREMGKIVPADNQNSGGGSPPPPTTIEAPEDGLSISQTLLGTYLSDKLTGNSAVPNVPEATTMTDYQLREQDGVTFKVFPDGTFEEYKP